MGTNDPASAGKSATGRLMSIDALRGFDMFWIAGGEEIVKAWAHWSGSPIANQIAEQFEHVEWEGFRFYDLIFPLFLFTVGIVLPFSLGKLRERGEPTSAIYWRILRRTVLLFVFGLIFNHIQNFNFPEMRWPGVLQRIALGYGFAALIYMNTRVRGQVLITAAILLGYWALLAFVPAPGSAAGDYTKFGNLPGYIDHRFLNKIFKEYYGYGDNEGILSTIPAVATALLGVLAGQWLRSSRPQRLKVLGLILAGLASLALGYAWSFRFPIIKNIWTSSFVLFAGGWSFLLLALFYLIIDVFQFRRWAYFFVVIGANAITIYLVQHFVDFDRISVFFFRGVAQLSGSLHLVVLAVGAVIARWVLLWFLYRKQIFLRV
jgi:predicted acyltransferase